MGMSSGTARLWVLPLLLLLTLGGCSATRLVNRWKENEYVGGPLSRVFIIGLVQDDLKRRSLEEEVAGRLERAGVAGVVSFRMMPDPKGADQESELVAIANRVGADSVLITRLQGVEKEQTYVPPRTEWVPAMGPCFGHYGCYGFPYYTVYQPGYTRTDTVVRLEVKLFSAADGRLLWGGNIESRNPDSAQKMIRELADVVVTDIGQSGLLP